MDARERAKQILSHYIRLCYERAGGKWHGDMDSELDEFIDAIIEAAAEAAVAGHGAENRS